MTFWLILSLAFLTCRMSSGYAGGRFSHKVPYIGIKACLRLYKAAGLASFLSFTDFELRYPNQTRISGKHVLVEFDKFIAT